MDIAVQGAEDPVAAGEDVLQMLRQSGVFPGCLGVPRAEKGGDCPGGGGVYTRQQLLAATPTVRFTGAGRERICGAETIFFPRGCSV